MFVEWSPELTLRPGGRAGRVAAALPHREPEGVSTRTSGVCDARDPPPRTGRPRVHRGRALLGPVPSARGAWNSPGGRRESGRATAETRRAGAPGGGRRRGETETAPAASGLRSRAAGDQRPLRRSAPPRRAPGHAPPRQPRLHAAPPNRRAAGGRVTGAHCYANIKAVKGSPARRAGERVQRRVGRRAGSARELQPDRPGARERGAAAPARPAPESAAPASVARPPGRGWMRRGPVAAAPGPQRPERPGAACGARGRRALHAPRRAPRQPGARAEPGPPRRARPAAA